MYKVLLTIALLVPPVVLSTSCARVGATSPGSASSVEQQIYADLITVQTALEGLKAESVQFPAIAANIKPQLNQAIATYNTAQTTFVSYEKAKSLNTANPADLVQLTTMVANIKAEITTLGQAFSKTPVAVASVPQS